MKYLKVIFSIVCGLLILTACTTNTQEENATLKAEIATLLEENSRLASGTLEMASDVNGYRSALAQIDQSIAAFDAMDSTVKALTANITNDVEVAEEILLHVQHIHGIMTNAKAKVAKLSRNLEELRKQENIDDEVILELELAIDVAAKEIMARDAVIEIMNQELIENEVDLSVLAAAYSEEISLTQALYTILNTAYFYSGSKQDLIDTGIVTEEGGILGLGKIKTLAATAEDKIFLQIPIDGTDTIKLICKKASLLTSHPRRSYSILDSDTIQNLIIKDKDAFWDKSDFLVVEVVRDEN